MSDTAPHDNPAANAEAAWQGIANGWSKKSAAPVPLHYVAVRILGLVFESARRRRVLERRIETLERKLAAKLGADAR